MGKKSEEVIRAQKRKKQHAVDMFGGKCSICGYDKCLEALEFHHLDKSTKQEKPSYIIMRWSWERAKEELDKCILVCSNCHKEIHAKEKEGVSYDLQNYLRPWINKTCECCDKSFETKREDQKYCSISCSSMSQRKVKRPIKEELMQLLEDKIPYTKIGKMFGVSDNAVRKWCNRYGLI